MVITHKETDMTKIFNSIYSFFCAIGQAKYAANLARNGKIKQAQDMYRD
jgi:hypothetical protein